MGSGPAAAGGVGQDRPTARSPPHVRPGLVWVTNAASSKPRPRVGGGSELVISSGDGCRRWHFSAGILGAPVLGCRFCRARNASSRRPCAGAVLSVGTLEAIRWARASFGDDRIRDWIVQHCGRQPSAPLREEGVHLETTGLADRTVHGRIHGVKVSFFEFRPPLLEPLVDWPEGGCRLAACEDLAAMKLLAVTQRGTKKDFIDVHALSHALPLEAMIDCHQRRFGVTEASRVLARLCYFDDAEAEPMPRMLDTLPTSLPAEIVVPPE